MLSAVYCNHISKEPLSNEYDMKIDVNVIKPTWSESDHCLHTITILNTNSCILLSYDYGHIRQVFFSD